VSRTSTAYASDYQRTRQQRVTLPRGEVRTLVANYNGVLEAGETIATATWRLTHAGVLSAAAIASDGRSTSVTVQAAASRGNVKVEALTSTGRLLPVEYQLEVQTSPWFNGESTIQSGPQTLTVSA
jgi:hypothetical protein